MNRAAVVGWGTMLNVAHLVRGIRTLHAAGQCHAALPLLRSVMEYALGTIWLADGARTPWTCSTAGSRAPIPSGV